MSSNNILWTDENNNPYDKSIVIFSRMVIMLEVVYALLAGMRDLLYTVVLAAILGTIAGSVMYAVDMLSK